MVVHELSKLPTAFCAPTSYTNTLPQVDRGEDERNVALGLVGRRRWHNLVGLVGAALAGVVDEAGDAVALVEATPLVEVETGARGVLAARSLGLRHRQPGEGADLPAAPPMAS